jgi:hypothetical protein
MSSSGFERQGSGADPRAAAAAKVAPAATAADRVLLEKVLEQTLVNLRAGETVPQSDMDALNAVVARHRGKPFVLEPVAVDMVAAVLGDQFRPLAGSPETWQGMIRQIAETLYEDPASRDRLGQLWIELCERRS